MKQNYGMMRRLLSWTAVAALTLTAVGCSDDDTSDEPNNPATNPTFPSMVEQQINAGDSYRFAFKADAAWSLSSSQSWCKFVKGDGIEETTHSGAAGSQTVTVHVTDEGQTEADAVAEVTMTMAGESKVVLKITRPGIKPEPISLTASITVDGQEIVLDGNHPLELSGGNLLNMPVMKVSLATNAENTNYNSFGFDPQFSATWVRIEQVQESDNAGGNLFNVAFKTARPGESSEGLRDVALPISADEGSKITFVLLKDGEAIANVEVPLVYNGPAADALQVQKNFFNITANAEGTELSQEDQNTGRTTVIGDKLSTKVVTLNYDYELVKFQPYKYIWSMSGAVEIPADFEADMSWVKVSKSGDRNEIAEVSVDAYDGSEDRYAMVMALPRATYEAIKGDLESNLLNEYGDIKSEYVDFIVADLTQKGVSGSGTGSDVTFALLFRNNGEGEIFYMSLADIGLDIKQPQIMDSTHPNYADLKGYLASEFGMSGNFDIWEVNIPNDVAEMLDENNMIAIEALGVPEGAMSSMLMGETYMELGLWSDYEVDHSHPYCAGIYLAPGEALPVQYIMGVCYLEESGFSPIAFCVINVGE